MCKLFRSEVITLVTSLELMKCISHRSSLIFSANNSKYCICERMTKVISCIAGLKISISNHFLKDRQLYRLWTILYLLLYL
jgi:hypothetical protein